MRNAVEFLGIALVAGAATWAACVVHALHYQRDHQVIKKSCGILVL